MAHRRSFRPRGGISQSQRRKKTWLSFGEAGLITAGVSLDPANPGVGPSQTLEVKGITSTDAGNLVEGTILRIRGSLDVPASNIPEQNEGFTIAFGIGFVTNEAFSASAVPNPATSEGADWDGWMFYHANIKGPAESAGEVFDVKSMRKWNDGMTFALIAGVANEGSDPPVNVEIQLIARALILLP